MEQWTVMTKKADFAEIAAKYNIDPVTARIIRNRDVIEDEDIRLFLHGSLKDLGNPHLLHEADLLVDILIEKIKQGKHIRVIGDYDIDGVMSTYILKSSLDAVGANVSIQIPDRIKDGYGLNSNLIEEAHNDAVDTIITCDNGIAALEEIKLAKEYGMTVLVTDHHEIPFDLVEEEKVYKRSLADAIVNPHQIECSYPYKNLCGAAVAWLVMRVLYERLGREPEEMEAYLENVAFATVGDVMDLMGENRILVKEGIKRIRHTENIGMQALIDACSINPYNINSYHFGFVLGPCINASGRLDTAKHALRLFFCKEKAEADKIAAELVTLNEQRKDMTQLGEDMAKEICESEEYQKDTVLVVYLPDVHESIAGIIAGRVRETFHKPAFVLTKSEDGVKGSGRSIENYSMFDEMNKCKELFTKFGGHPMAAGLSLPEENVDAFRRKINELSPLKKEDLIAKIRIDVPMPISYVSMDLIQELAILEPLGKANPKPIFADRKLKLKSIRKIGKNQNVIKMILEDSYGHKLDAIQFRGAQQLYEYLESEYGQNQIALAEAGKKNDIVLDIVYYPKINEYMGTESIQLEIQSVR